MKVDVPSLCGSVGLPVSDDNSASRAPRVTLVSRERHGAMLTWYVGDGCDNDAGYHAESKHQSVSEFSSASTFGLPWQHRIVGQSSFVGSIGISLWVDVGI